MTTSSTFGVTNYPDPIRGNFGPTPQPVAPPVAPKEITKADILRENIEKFIKGEISAKQLEVIKATLS